MENLWKTKADVHRQMRTQYPHRHERFAGDVGRGFRETKKFKKVEKKMKKGVDKRGAGWYYTKAVANDSEHETVRAVRKGGKELENET